MVIYLQRSFFFSGYSFVSNCLNLIAVVVYLESGLYKSVLSASLLPINFSIVIANHRGWPHIKDYGDIFFLVSFNYLFQLSANFTTSDWK